MQKKLQINLLSCNHRSSRFPFSVRMFQELESIENFDAVRLCIHGEAGTITAWKQYLTQNAPKLEVILYEYNNSDYLSRIDTAHKTDCEYSCKVDDDVFINRYVWDYMINNLHMINEQNPIISPILTNGMPSVELFMKDLLDEKDLEIAHSILLNGSIPTNLWGLDYTEINNKIRSMNKWDGREYWDFVSKVNTKWETNSVPWYYFIVRGVHPARFSAEYNLFIANKIFENKSKIFNKQEYHMEEYPAPYFTNNIFISKTKYWIDTLKLFNDGWDEGQLSLRMIMDKSSILYVRNGLGIHMAYGMTDQASLIEKTYMENL